MATNPEKHLAAKKRVVLFEDLKDDLLLIPRKDLLPTKYQAIIDLLLAAGMTDMRTQEIEHPLTALALASANAGFAFVPASAQELSAREVVFGLSAAARHWSDDPETAKLYSVFSYTPGSPPQQRPCRLARLRADR